MFKIQWELTKVSQGVRIRIDVPNAHDVDMTLMKKQMQETIYNNFFNDLAFSGRGYINIEVLIPTSH